MTKKCITSYTVPACMTVNCGCVHVNLAPVVEP